MNFGENLIRTVKTRQSISVKDEVGDLKEGDLSLYTNPPSETITLIEFKDLGSLRLELLKKIEGFKEKHPSVIDSDKFRHEGLKNEPDLVKLYRMDDEESRRQDRISHFILRLAFCQSPEQTKWFIQQELDLFKLRFKALGHGKKELFLKQNNFNLSNVDNSEKDVLREVLISSNFGVDNKNYDRTAFYKVYFTEAFDLVRNRKVFINRGYLYITYDELVVIVSSKFRLHMATGMAREFKHLGFIQEEDRLLPLLKALTHRGYTNKSYKAQSSKDVTPDMVDELATKSFPLCMRQIHQRFRSDHHLRHFARRQYGLFLKGIGMSLESSLALFRDEFTKKMDADKFNKQYGYNVRHMYGKEGRHVESNPFDCPKIILTNPPAAQDCHGCPYRHSEPDALAIRLERLGINKEQITQIIQLSKNHQYDRACARYFECSHDMPEGGLGGVITHPNQYYDLSRKILEGKRSTGVGCSQITASTNPLNEEMDITVENVEDDDSFNDDSVMQM